MFRSERQHVLGDWPEIRKDLEILRSDEGGIALCLVTDPLSGEVFEFGEEEDFLLQSMDGESGATVTIRRFEERFSTNLGFEELNAFIEMLDEWGLLVGSGGPAAPLPEDSLPDEEVSAPEPEPEPAPAPEPTPEPVYPDDDEDSEVIVSRFRPGRRRHAGNAEPTTDTLDADFEEAGGWSGADEPGMGPPDPQRWRAAAGVDDGRSDAEDDSRHWSWFACDGFMRGLAGVLSPLRYLVWLVPVLLGIGAATVFNNLHAFTDDFVRFRVPLTIFQNLLFSMVTINLATQVARGVIASAVGAEARSFGIKMIFGLIPRFEVLLAGLPSLERKDKLWVHGGPLLVRMAVFGVAAIFWSMTRNAGTFFSAFNLMLMIVSFISFVLSAMPLLNGNGHQVLATLLDMPDLRQRANRALFGKLRRRGRSEDDEENQHALRIFALASFIFIFAILGLALILIARWLELNYQGTGVAIFLVLFLFLIVRFRKQMHARRARRKQAARDARISEFKSGPQRALARLRGGLPDTELAPRGRRAEPPAERSWLSYGVLAVFVIVLFLPYQYETGGPVNLLPLQRQEIHTETAGAIRTVAFQGGEFVEAGTVIATVASTDQEKAVQSTQAAIAEQQAELERLLSSPTQEEIQLAESQLETARVQARFSDENAARLERVFSTGAISLEDFEEAKKKREVDRAQVIEADANLRKVRIGPHPKEIEAAQIELQGLRDQLSYYQEQLLLTELHMPFDGRIVTLNLRDKIGQFLDKGDLFAIVEDDTSVRVEIEVPQADVGEIEIGGAARIKIWTYPDRLFEGKVTDIAPVVAEENYGKVVMVTTVIDNQKGLLKSGMTGFGKIEGGTKPVGIAFTRAFVRFFLIEFWSWIP